MDIKLFYLKIDFKINISYIYMLIPVKCVTCGKVIANKYMIYLEEVKQRKTSKNMEHDSIEYLDTSKIKKTIEGEVMDELGLNDICCRRHVLTHVDIL
jgi:DNA-directed RNA polymerase subunit N (RpoN/RPB10)|tara:strand:- start:1668 stop:1961 length:294 start_codon:yes stop_codon:yes gene_type:complete